MLVSSECWRPKTKKKQKKLCKIEILNGIQPIHRVCKDSSKKFCPSCGNPTLIRASVSARAPNASGGSSTTTPDGLHVHLKPNFQYRTRGTIYSIPSPKMGSAKGQSGGGSGLILREDQKEFMSAVRREEGRRKKEERQLEKAVRLEVEGKGKGLGGWNDPDVRFFFFFSFLPTGSR
jgi:RNA-binding protein NOB1